MPYARIFIKAEKKQEDVNVNQILDFWSNYSSGGDPTKKVFRLQRANGKSINCQVLRISDTLEALRKEVSAKRSRVPKLNQTLFDESEDPDDVQPPISKPKKNKADEMARKKNAEIETGAEILDAYNNALQITSTNTEDDAAKRSERDLRAKQNEKDLSAKRIEKDLGAKQNEKHLGAKRNEKDLGVKRNEKDLGVKRNEKDLGAERNKKNRGANRNEKDLAMAPKKNKTARIIHTSESDNDDINQTSSSTAYDICISDSEQSSTTVVRDDLQPNNDHLIMLYENIDELEREVTCWKQMYEDLKTSKQYPLTEKTGQEIVGALKAPRHTLASSHADSAIIDGNSSPVPRKPEIMYLGSGLTIKQSVYDSFSRKLEPSKFFGSLAQYVFGIETLANRCVRAQANVKEQELEEDKKEIVVKHFLEWLKNKAQYPQHLISLEENKISKYFNSAITSARKKIKRSKLPIELSDPGASDKENCIKRETATPKNVLTRSLTLMDMNIAGTSKGGTKRKATQRQSQDDVSYADRYDSAETVRNCDSEDSASSTSHSDTKKFKAHNSSQSTDSTKIARKHKKLMQKQSQDDAQQISEPSDTEKTANDSNIQNSDSGSAECKSHATKSDERSAVSNLDKDTTD